MSDLERELAARKKRLEAKVAAEVSKVKRSLSGRLGRGLAWCVIGLLWLVALLFATFAWYSTTDNFDRRVRGEVVKVLEDATGGRVELGKISFDLRHLMIEANGLVIHGLEGPGEAPYLSADTIVIRVRLFNFFRSEERRVGK